MRVLLSTHSAATRASFGIVAREIWTRLLAADPDLEVVQHGWFHEPAVDAVPFEIVPTDCPILTPGPDGEEPALDDMYGDRTFGDLVAAEKPDLVWHLGDPYMGQAMVAGRSGGDYRFVWYYPVAREPFNHFRTEWVAKLAAADRLVAATAFGARILEAVPGLRGDSIPHIHHGVDTQTFRPVEDAERSRLRAEIGGGAVSDDAFVLGWVGLDQYRKQVWTLYELLYYLRSGEWIRCRRCDRVTVREYDHRLRCPRDVATLRTYERGYDYSRCWYCRSGDIESGRPRDDVVLWTVMANDPSIGWDLRLLVETYDLGNAVFDSTHDRGGGGHSFADMAGIYNTFDALVFPSGAEGFGMPVLEAMACGVPVIFGDYSAHAEFAVGRSVRVRFVPDTPDPSFLGFVDMGDLVRNALALIEDPAERRRLSIEARAKACGMDWDTFTPAWRDLLEGCLRGSPRGR